jgi:protein-disulfide isomerase
MTKKNTPAKRSERAAEALREQQRQEARRRNSMYAVVAGVLILVIVGGFLWMRASDSVDDVAAPAAGSENGLAIGDPDAPHTVVIYEDFLCPYCGQLEAATRDGLAQAAEDGKVYVEYRPFVLLSQVGDYSERATNAFAVVMEESGAEVAKSFHDVLFENQPEESAEEFPDDDQLVDWAVEAGADEAAVRPGIEGMAQQDWVDAATQAATDARVPGTPYIELDGENYQEGSDMTEIGNSLVDAVQ